MDWISATALKLQLTASLPSGGFDCKACGACCSFSADWPRFSTEDEADLGLIPAKYVSEDESGMRCDGVRCTALAGKVGESTSCGIYDIRPDVCRACVPGGDDCGMARQAHGLRMLDAAENV